MLKIKLKDEPEIPTIGELPPKTVFKHCGDLLVKIEGPLMNGMLEVFDLHSAKVRNIYAWHCPDRIVNATLVEDYNGDNS